MTGDDSFQSSLDEFFSFIDQVRRDAEQRRRELRELENVELVPTGASSDVPRHERCRSTVFDLEQKLTGVCELQRGHDGPCEPRVLVRYGPRGIR